MTNYVSPIIIPHDTSVPGKFMIKIGVANQTNSAYSYEVELQVQIDTGSCGIVIPATALYLKNESDASTATKDSTTGETACTATQLALMPLLPGVTTTYEPATIVYQPSGDSIIGFYYHIAELGIGEDEQGNPLVIAKNVKVMGATSASPFMMGVGFDRPLIADNAFLANLTTANNNSTPLYPSYYLDHQTVELGLSPSNAFAFQTLAVQTQGAPETYQDWNWNTPQGSITVANAEATLLTTTPVSLLIDTGLDLMMVNNMGTLFPLPGIVSSWDTANITLEFNANSAASVPSCFSFPLTGTAQAKLSPGGDTLTLVYTTENSVVTITEASLPLQDSSSVSTPAPTLVHVISNQDVGNPFINTGFNPLFAYGMMFDPTGNQVGLKSLSLTS
ncbi:MAG: hypothetical protein Q8L37_00010 [Candidatus Gottesmanbacteria bacterium]|nr:hypothetical protein [Candidatus Gottesmanbacteria bacterium]